MRNESRTTFVTRDCPLIVEDPGQPMEYTVIYFEKGGYIELLCGSEFTIHKLLPIEAYDGPKEELPKPVSDSRRLEQWDYDIIIAGRDGKNGKNGQNGQNGGTASNGENGRSGYNGKDGQKRPDFALTINDLQMNLSLLNIGGRGGNGGKGGDGGRGGSGSSE